jgi:integrase
MLGKKKRQFVLTEPARTVIAVAAFTGLRESEIRGLRWEDYKGDALDVRRSIWRTHVGETKTPESKSVVPVIAPLRKIIDAHRASLRGAGSWIFSGPKKGFSLHLDNLCARDIRPALGDRWHGWHAFRRGLATNLFSLGVPAEVAQTILRHANVSTTRQHYIVLESRDAGREAMRKLERVIESGPNVAQRKPRSRKNPHKHSTEPR